MLPDDHARASFMARLGLFYGAAFAIYGIQLPYLPLWLSHRGLTPTEIAVVSALPLFLRVLATPLVAVAADRHGQHRRAIVMLSAIGLAGAGVLMLPGGVPVVAAGVTMLMIATYCAMPLTETIAMAGVRAANLDYGRMRLWGSLSFIVMNVGGGVLVARQGAPVVGTGLLAAAAMMLVAAVLLPTAQLFDANRPKLTRALVQALVTRPGIVLLVLASGAIQSSHAVFYTFGVLHWQQNGLSTAVTGALWGVSIVLEVVLFTQSRRLVAWCGPSRLMVIGGTLAVARWATMALDPSLPLLVLLQACHAGSFTATHIGTVHLTQQLAPKGTEGTAQALLTTFNAGIMMGSMTALSGPLYASGGSLSYLAMSALAACGVAAALRLDQRYVAEPANLRA